MEDAKKDGRVRWKYIRKLESAHVGRKPVATSAILHEQGNLIESSGGLCARWRKHFESILNVPSQFNVDAIRDMPSHEVWGILDLEPAFEELTSAIRRMKRGTAGGQSDILPENLSLVVGSLCTVVSTLCYSRYGHRWTSPATGVMPRLCPSLRKVIFVPVTTGGE